MITEIAVALVAAFQIQGGEVTEKVIRRDGLVAISGASAWPSLGAKDAHSALVDSVWFAIQNTDRKLAQSSKLVGREFLSGSNAFQRLSRSSGYSNLVLADSIARVHLHHLIRLLIAGENPTLIGELARSFTSGEADFGASRIERDLRVPSAPNQAPFVGLLRDAEQPGGLELSTTSRLLKQPSGGALLRRVWETECVAGAWLPALAQYVTKGGRIEDLRTSDVSAFYASLGQFAQPEQHLGLSDVYVSDLLKLLNDVRGGGRRLVRAATE